MSTFAKLIHDKQLLVLAIAGVLALGDIVLGLHYSQTEILTGAGVVATYLGTSTFLAVKHAQGEHAVATAQASGRSASRPAASSAAPSPASTAADATSPVGTADVTQV